MKRIPVRALIFLPVLIWLPFLGQFPYPVKSAFSDITITHFPNAVYLLQSIKTWSEVPLWSNTILSGYPFAANPLSGLWYPFGWPALLLPLPFGFNLMVMLHWLWGGFGMYRFMRSEGLSEGAAAFSGMVLIALPRIAAHFAAGHLTLSYAIPWTPWFLWFAGQSIRAGKQSNPVPESLVLGMIILADVRWSVYALLLWLAYRLFHGQFAAFRNNGRQAAASFAGPILAGVGLAAPLLIPLIEYTNLSTRQSLLPQDNLILSLEPARLLGLLSPGFDGNTEWTIYPGGGVFLLYLWVLLHPDMRRRNKFWIGLVLAALVLSLGSNLPGMDLLARLPGFNLLRVPARFLILAGFGFAAVAGRGLDGMSAPHWPLDPRAYWSRLGVAGMMGLISLVALGTIFLTHSLPKNLLWGCGAILISGTIIFFRDAGKLTGRAAVVLLVIVCLIDLAGTNLQSVSFRTGEAVLKEGSEITQHLPSSTRGLYRVYSPSYSLPQQTSAVSGLEMASGIDPLQLKSYVDFLARASGVPLSSYSVAQPPLDAVVVSQSNADALPDARLLGWLNVRYIAADYDLSIPGLKQIQVHGSNSIHIYENQLALPRVWLQAPGTPFGEQIKPAVLLGSSPNRMIVQVTGPGILVLSEINYPGWQVSVDGKSARIDTAQSLFRAVEISSGDHRVEFVYRPLSVVTGLIVTILTIVLLVVTRIFRREPL